MGNTPKEVSDRLRTFPKLHIYAVLSGFEVVTQYFETNEVYQPEFTGRETKTRAHDKAGGVPDREQQDSKPDAQPRSESFWS